MGRWFHCIKRDGFMFVGDTICVLRPVFDSGDAVWYVGSGGWELPRTSERLMDKEYYMEVSEEEAMALLLGKIK